MSPIFTKCSVLYLNISVDEDHRVCISLLCIIVDRQSGFKFCIPLPHNFSAEQCTATFDTHVVPTMGKPYYIVFDTDTLFMSSHFLSWVASKAIKLEPSTACHPQMDGQSEIMNEEIIQVARACKAEGIELLSKIPEIQLRLNLRYNASRRNNPFVTVLGFDDYLGLDTFPYLINKYQTGTECHKATSQALSNAKTSEAKPANLHRTLEPQHMFRNKVL